MTRAELYKKIVEDVLNNHPEIIQNVDEIKDELELNGLSNALSLILDDNNITNLNFKRLFYTIKNNLREDNIDNLDDYGVLTVSRQQYEKKDNKRNFIWQSLKLSVINCEDFFQNNQAYNENVMFVIEQICYTDNNRNDFLYYLKNDRDNGNNYYYIIHDINIYPLGKEWNIYMFCISLYLNDQKKFNLDSNLQFTPFTYLQNHQYNNTARYDQYSDIYDVIGEWNSCKDILSAFLKMYQILEYIIYRQELVKIVNGTNIKRSFVRQIKGVDRKYTNNERSSFIKGLNHEFPSLFTGKINTIDHVTDDVEKFCENYYPKNDKGQAYMTNGNINNTNTINDCIAKFIYDTRCSIVHNKESEFHMTAINYSEYTAIVPLMKKILSIVGEELYNLINKSSNGIIFNNPSFDLY